MEPHRSIWRRSHGVRRSAPPSVVSTSQEREKDCVGGGFEIHWSTPVASREQQQCGECIPMQSALIVCSTVSSALPHSRIIQQTRGERTSLDSSAPMSIIRDAREWIQTAELRRCDAQTPDREKPSARCCDTRPPEQLRLRPTSIQRRNDRLPPHSWPHPCSPSEPVMAQEPEGGRIPCWP